MIVKPSHTQRERTVSSPARAGAHGFLLMGVAGAVACARPASPTPDAGLEAAPNDRTLAARALEGDFPALATLSERVEWPELLALIGTRSASISSNAEPIELGVEPRGETGTLFPGPGRSHFLVFAAAPSGERTLVHLELGASPEVIPTPKGLALYDLRGHETGDGIEVFACAIARSSGRPKKPSLLRFTPSGATSVGRPVTLTKDACDFDTTQRGDEVLVAMQVGDETRLATIARDRPMSISKLRAPELEHPRFVVTATTIDLVYGKRPGSKASLGTYRARIEDAVVLPTSGMSTARLANATFSEAAAELPRGAALPRSLWELVGGSLVPHGTITLPPQLDRSPRRAPAWIVDPRGEPRAVIGYDAAILAVGREGASILAIGAAPTESVSAIMEGSSVRVVFAEVGSRRVFRTLVAPIGPTVPLEAALAEVMRRTGEIRHDTLSRLVLTRLSMAESRLQRGDFAAASRDAIFALRMANAQIELSRARGLIEQLVVRAPRPALAELDRALQGQRSAGLKLLVAELDIPTGVALVPPSPELEDDARFIAFDRILDPSAKARAPEVPVTQCLVLDRGDPSPALRAKLGDHLAFLKFPPECPKDAPRTELVLSYATSPDDITVYARSGPAKAQKHHAIHMLRRSGALELMSAKERPSSPESYGAN